MEDEEVRAEEIHEMIWVVEAVYSLEYVEAEPMHRGYGDDRGNATLRKSSTFFFSENEIGSNRERSRESWVETSKECHRSNGVSLCRVAGAVKETYSKDKGKDNRGRSI